MAPDQMRRVRIEIRRQPSPRNAGAR
jgi:hypothetical protein